MSKAEELAEKAYPEGDTYIFGDGSIACQVAYVKGYHQAEKDLELSWEDLALMRLAFDATEDNILKISKMTKEYYQEVLKRFKDLKEREEK